MKLLADLADLEGNDVKCRVRMYIYSKWIYGVPGQMDKEDGSWMTPSTKYHVYRLYEVLRSSNLLYNVV